MALVPMLYQASFSGKSFRAVFARMVDFVDVAHVFSEAVGLLHVLVADGTLELRVGLSGVSPRVLAQSGCRPEPFATLVTNMVSLYGLSIDGFWVVVPCVIVEVGLDQCSVAAKLAL